MSKNNDDFHSDALAKDMVEQPDSFSDTSVHEYEPAVDNLPAEVPATTPAPASKPAVKSSFAGGTWVALIAGALLLIVLLVFILQNQQPVDLTLFAWKFTFPAGVGFLLAAIAGALIMALVGGVRMLQLRRQIKKN
ncbi:MAG: lipopolysaccharide assembly protein LapA domain-containing protein [Corynebacterium sp.]|uniref:LapA family protein n=1 Tax=Corynebacterium sp. TaxID=1720 RepID=UPI0026DD56E9|nr:lipopolysaccharide assembly protein LapA domain-containing protein [Corynebacterium sp.]MDO5097974.1 lipopolysaccharide assembly protein LapA domain-containing protein [Corynebacterium sp.]